MRIQHGPQRARDFGPLRVSILGLDLNVNWLVGWWMDGFPIDQVANTALIDSCHLTVCLYSLLLTFKEFIKTSCIRQTPRHWVYHIQSFPETERQRLDLDKRALQFTIQTGKALYPNMI